MDHQGGIKKKTPRSADWVIPRSFASFFKLFVLSKSSQVAGADFHDCLVLPKFKDFGFHSQVLNQ